MDLEPRGLKIEPAILRVQDDLTLGTQMMLLLQGISVLSKNTQDWESNHLPSSL